MTESRNEERGAVSGIALPWLVVLALVWSVASGIAQQTAPQAPARRIEDRMAALQREAERLAAESKTLVGDLRRLELERELQVERQRVAEAAAADAEAARAAAAARVAALEQQRAAQLPDLKVRFVDLYKRGRGGYARLLAGANNVKELARATRALSALTRINQIRIEEHRRTLAAMRAEQANLTSRLNELQAQRTAAARARAAADRAVSARSALIADIDTRRDLTAQFAGELQVARERLQRLTASGPGSAEETVAVPLRPFRGALDWPASGRVIGRFGDSSNRLGGTAVRNGIDIETPEGTVVRAVHGGTVAYAEPFTGFGNLVIIDHGGNNYSLYGYLAAPSVARGDRVEAGAELGRTGLAPAGPAALYFEMRIDGRSTDPVQWLKPR